MKLRLLTLLVLAIPLSAQTYTFSTLASNLNNPHGLILDTKDDLYGIMGSQIFELPAVSKKVSILHTWSSDTPTSIIRNTKTGVIYGTTMTTIFKLTSGKAGKYTYSLIYSNASADFAGGTLDTAGNLYGTDQACLSQEDPCIWEIPVGGEWEDIYNIDPSDVGEPYSLEGNLVTQSGDVYASASFNGDGGYGWVQEVGGNFIVSGPPNAYPVSLRQDAIGDIYGLAQGFSEDGQYADIFKNSTILYQFLDDSQPAGNFSVDKSGNVFGTTFYTETQVFEFSQGQLIQLYANPDLNMGLVMDSAGNLYGTTTSTIWKMTK